MMKRTPTSASRMTLRVCLVVVMIVLICCFTAYLLYANSDAGEAMADSELLDQAGIVLAVLLGVAAILLLIVNGWANKPVAAPTLLLFEEVGGWKRELQKAEVILRELRKTETAEGSESIDAVSAILTDLIIRMEKRSQEYLPEKE